MDTARADDTRQVRERKSKSSLEQLAADGTDYTRAFSSAPWTLPSHASLFTGTYTSKHGAYAATKQFDGGQETIGEILSDHGYDTVGITNNAWVTDEFGLATGFEEFYKVWQYYQTDFDFGQVRLTSRGTEQVKRAIDGALSGDIPKNVVNAIYGQFFYRRNDYGAKRTNELAADWLESRQDDDPFFMFVNYLEPHLDYQPPKSYARPYLPEDMSYDEAMSIPQEPWKFVTGALSLSDRELAGLRALYRAEIAYLDDRIGELAGTVEGKTGSRETVFIVVGDHGENIGDHGLMEHQYSVHDTLIHVPLIVSGGEFSSSGTTDRLVQTLDLFSTLLDVADVDIETQSQGRSFHPRSSAEERSSVVAEYLAPQPSIDRLSDETGLPRDELARFDQQIRAIHTGSHKLTRYERDGEKLYELDSSGETENCIDERPELAERLRGDLDQLLESFSHHEADEEAEMSASTRDRLEDLGYLT